LETSADADTGLQELSARVRRRHPDLSMRGSTIFRGLKSTSKPCVGTKLVKRKARALRRDVRIWTRVLIHVKIDLKIDLQKRENPRETTASWLRIARTRRDRHRATCQMTRVRGTPSGVPPLRGGDPTRIERGDATSDDIYTMYKLLLVYHTRGHLLVLVHDCQRLYRQVVCQGTVMAMVLLVVHTYMSHWTYVRMVC